MTDNLIDPQRLAEARTITLDAGAHSSIKEGACLMEVVSYVTRSPWSDHPPCTSPVIGAFARRWNDALDADARDRLLKPLIPTLVGTNTGRADDDTRAWMALDWLVRTYTPPWLRLAGLTDQAETLAGLPEFRAGMDVPSVRPAIQAARTDAAAAWTAAGDAARDAAGAAAVAAAWAAARDAAFEALKPTVTRLQDEALALFERMLAEAWQTA